MATVVQEDMEVFEMPMMDGLFEIVGGKSVEKRMGAYEAHVVTRVTVYLGHYLLEFPLGHVEVEMLFNFGIQGAPQRRPDVSYISHDRWPRERRITSENAIKVVPDLAVEVVSPTNLANEVEERIIEYLKVGVRLVWVIFPTTRRLYAHDGSPTIRVFSGDDELDGGAVLPDFRLKLSNLFGGWPEDSGIAPTTS